MSSLPSSLLTIALVAGLAAGCATAGARVTKDDALRTALAQTPGGTVKESEIETENGRLVWSFDIATPGTADITEVQVDAKTGAIALVEHETPADQQKEHGADAKKN